MLRRLWNKWIGQCITRKPTVYANDESTEYTNDTKNQTIQQRQLYTIDQEWIDYQTILCSAEQSGQLVDKHVFNNDNHSALMQLTIQIYEEADAKAHNRQIQLKELFEIDRSERLHKQLLSDIREILQDHQCIPAVLINIIMQFMYARS